MIGYARRRLAGRVGRGRHRRTGRRHRRSTSPASHHLEVPPLDAGDMIDLLGQHGLPAARRPAAARRVRRRTRRWPWRSCGAVGEQPVAARPAHRRCRPRSSGCCASGSSPSPRTSAAPWRSAALLHRPTVRQLERAGRLGRGGAPTPRGRARAGARSDDAVRFTPAALRRVVAESTPAGAGPSCTASWPRSPRPRRSRCGTAPSPTRGPDADARPRAGGVAAEAPPPAGPARSRPSSTSWPPTGRRPTSPPSGSSGWPPPSRPAPPATTPSWCTGRWRLPRRCRPTPAQMVRVRLALPELAGSGVAAMDEVLTAALADAGDDDRAGRDGAAPAGPGRADGVAPGGRRPARRAGGARCCAAPATGPARPRR